MLSEDLSFCMVADDFDVNEASQIELLGSKHRHFEDLGGCDALIEEGEEDSMFRTF